MKVAADVAALGRGGRRLWDEITAEHGEILTPWELVILLEACRAKDRCDWLAAAGEDRQAGLCAKALSSLLAALRLPHPVTGRRPRRTVTHGAYRPR